MKKQRIYLDTSVIGGCFDREFEHWSNALMNDFRCAKLTPVVSEVIAAEIADAPLPVQARYADLLQWGAEVIVVTEEALRLADLYQQRGIVTPKFYDDGMHIALAAINAVDVLVSWNFRHIVHFDKIRQFNAVNVACGYQPLAIYSPREVATDDDNVIENGGDDAANSSAAL